MRKVLVTGKANSGKTTLALREAVAFSMPEIAYLTNEISVGEFMLLIGRIFNGSNLYAMSDHEVVIDDEIRITYIHFGKSSAADLKKRRSSFDVLIDDTVEQGSASPLNYLVPRELYIKVLQMQVYDEVLMAGV